MTDDGKHMLDLDPRMTFDSFVVGPANRLASAAARRVAESPGVSYNPLFLYSASGLGKSHILSAIAHQSGRIRSDRSVVYQTLEGYLGELARALEDGTQDRMRERYRDLDILLLDDVQFLTGQSQAQEMLLRTLDTLTSQGSQVVLASDRAPAEINGLDARLLSRFSGGLIVDIGAPDYETRVAIIRRKSDERGVGLGSGVAETMARYPFRNVRELQGALNRLLAVQELEERPIAVGDVKGILGHPSGDGRDGGDELLEEELTLPEGPPTEEPWRALLREAAEEGEQDGFDTGRLRRLLDADLPPPDPDQVAAEFRRRIGRLREIRSELEEAGNPWPEAATRILSDPDRLDEGEDLLRSARERARGFPTVPAEGPGIDGLAHRFPRLVVRAGERLVLAERPDFSPLFVVSSRPQWSRELLEAMGRTFRERTPDGRVALVSLAEFSEDFIRAISDGVAGAWRERWWTLELLLLHGVEGLSDTERAQEEFFHLFEALKRRGARIVLAADRAPSEIRGIDDRLRSRFEGGLLVEIDSVRQVPGAVAPDSASPAVSGEPADAALAEEPDPGVISTQDRAAGSERQAENEDEAEHPLEEEGKQIVTVVGPGKAPGRVPEVGPAEAGRELDGPAEASVHSPAEGRGAGAAEENGRDGTSADPGAGGADSGGAGAPGGRPWSPSREKVVWRWPRLEDRILELSP